MIRQKRTIDRILISTMPRSSTVFFFEMISRVFGFSKLEPKFTGGFVPNPPEWDPYKFDETYGELGEGEVLCAHYPLSHEIEHLLESDSLLGIYLYRDPRDVAVSAALYIKYALTHHALHELFLKMSDSEAIAFMLSGGVVPVDSDGASDDSKYILYEGMKYFCDWGERWLSHPNVAKVRYEDYVTHGDLAIRQAVENVGVSIGEDALKKVLNDMSFERMASGRAMGVEDKRSHFRKGIIGDHKNHFNPFHRSICKKQIGEFLIKYGYERDYAW